MVFVLLAILPLQSNLLTIKGYSIIFVCFGFIFLYQIWFRPRIILRSTMYTSFIAGFAFVGLSYIIELLHGNADQYYLFRLAFMFFGGVVIASMCRGKLALNTAICGYMIGTAIMATILIASSYGNVSSAAMYSNVSSIAFERNRVFSNSFLQDNLNQIAFFASQGSIMALAFVLKSSGARRAIFTCICLLCTVATFLPMSRSGMIVMALGIMAIGYAYGLAKPQVIGLIAIIAIIIIIAVPDVALKRMKFSFERNVATGVYEDSRTPVYGAVIHHFPDYIWTGVGIGNFYKNWGKKSQFAKFGGVSGPHNCYAQAAINWGILSLLALIGVIWRAYKRFPKNDCKDSIYLSLVGLSVGAIVWSMTTQCIEGKEFSVILGFLAAADMWSLPKLNIKVPRTRLMDFHRGIKPSYQVQLFRRKKQYG